MISSCSRLNTIEFLIKSSQHLQVSPIVKYSAFSFFADRFLPSLPPFIKGASSLNWLLQPVTESTLQLFVLISIWISSKIHDSKPLSVASLKFLADNSINEQHFTNRNFLEAEVLFMQVLNFEIGTANIAFSFLDELWIQIKGVAKVGELINFEACMEIMDLLYEKEETAFLYRSPHSLAASILVISTFHIAISMLQIILYKILLLESCHILLQVVSYVMTVPKQKWEFPVLAWVNFAASCKEEDIIKMATEILKHVLEPC
ncbi:cyclin-J18 isoform X2 [Cicer arietinum]|uniref:B-like cyclin n=1 Tax=Cicer arietinum TaxID=3827 RepID=A0A3Q7XPA3_CICAR|nr:cyclin-J18 isoform X2 [Cicer arietinum]